MDARLVPRPGFGAALRNENSEAERDVKCFYNAILKARFGFFFFSFWRGMSWNKHRWYVTKERSLFERNKWGGGGNLAAFPLSRCSQLRRNASSCCFLLLLRGWGGVFSPLCFFTRQLRHHVAVFQFRRFRRSQTPDGARGWKLSAPGLRGAGSARTAGGGRAARPLCARLGAGPCREPLVSYSKKRSGKEGAGELWGWRGSKDEASVVRCFWPRGLLRSPFSAWRDRRTQSCPNPAFPEKRRFRRERRDHTVWILGYVSAP